MGAKLEVLFSTAASILSSDDELRAEKKKRKKQNRCLRNRMGPVRNEIFIRMALSHTSEKKLKSYGGGGKKTFCFFFNTISGQIRVNTNLGASLALGVGVRT